LDFGSNTVLIVLDMQNTPGIGPDYYVPVLHYKALAGSPQFTVQTYGVINSQYQLCANTVRSTSNLYVHFYDCATAPAPGQAPPLPAGTLPDGSNTLNAQSGPGSASASAPASAGGQGSGGGGGSSKFPQWWQIILIIIACILVLAIIILIISFVVIKCLKDDDDSYEKTH
jgi:hypothetical protein